MTPQEGREGRGPIFLVSGREGGREDGIEQQAGPPVSLAQAQPSGQPQQERVPSLGVPKELAKCSRTLPRDCVCLKGPPGEGHVQPNGGHLRSCRGAFPEHLRAHLIGGCLGAQRVLVFILKTESASRESTQALSLGWAA